MEAGLPLQANRHISMAFGSHLAQLTPRPLHCGNSACVPGYGVHGVVMMYL
jgi:hypothetical protein